MLDLLSRDGGVVLVGASVGAGAALAASRDGCVSGVAELSPVPDRADPVAARTSLVEYGNRPLFVAVARGDLFSYPTAQEHRVLARGEVAWWEVEGRRHGTDLLDDERVSRALQEWIGGALVACRG